MILWTLKDDTAKRIINENVESSTINPGWNGIIKNINTVKKKVIKGDIMNIKKLELEGTIISLSNNFKPSANGCKKPNRPVTLGPFLLCTEAITFLSTKVKSAIEINIKTIFNMKKSTFSVKKENIL